MNTYGLRVHAPFARAALADVADLVLTQGDEVRPRGMLTKELRHLTVVVEDPTDWSLAGMNANWSPKIAAVEGISLCGGFSDVEWMRPRAPSLVQFANEETGELDGAYGPRVEATLPEVVRRLRKDKDTRQAIIPIYEREHALNPKSKDYPCTMTLHFLIRSGRLDLDVSMRSNDVNWGLKHDLSQFMILQCTVANLLGILPGMYVHTADSMHLYEESFEWARNLKWQPHSKVPFGGLEVFHPHSVDRLFHVARDIAYNPTPALSGEPEVNAWFREVLHDQPVS